MVYSSVISMIIDLNKVSTGQNLKLTGHFVLFVKGNIVVILKWIQNFVAKLMQKKNPTFFINFFFFA